MEFFTSDDVRRLCAQVNHFSQKANWRFKSLPVMNWQFASRNDFHNARMTLLAALDKELIPMSANAVERTLSDTTTEIDCYGTTFRLSLVSI